MGTMKVIIDIPEEEYNIIKASNAPITWAEHLIANGTPLPRGYGKLIDADAFQRYCFNKYFDKRLSAEGLAIINMFLAVQPTIIEADAPKRRKGTPLEENDNGYDCENWIP